MENFPTLLTNIAKLSILDVCRGLEYVLVFDYFHSDWSRIESVVVVAVSCGYI